MVQAVVMTGSDKPLEVVDLQLDGPKAGEMRVRIAASGVCHSDLSLYQGGGLGTPLPTVMGHEAAGVVEAVGADVAGFAPGDHVVLTVVPQCGVCPFCSAGQPTLCVEGYKSFVGMLSDGTSRFMLDGTRVSQAAGLGAWSEATVVPANAAVRIDVEMPLVPAALLGCAVITGFGAATITGAVKAGERVAVIGCGGVGLNSIQGARIAGAEQIIGIDLLQNKLDLARRLGATDVVNAKEADALEAVRDLTGGVGVDVVLDFVGSSAVVQRGLAMTRRGGRYVATASAAATWEIPVGELLGGAKTLRGNLLGMGEFKTEIVRLVELYQRGQLLLDELISQRLGLDEANRAFEDMKQGEVARSVLQISA